jgi:hypothetical protein
MKPHGSIGRHSRFPGVIWLRRLRNKCNAMMGNVRTALQVNATTGNGITTMVLPRTPVGHLVSHENHLRRCEVSGFVLSSGEVAMNLSR